MQDNGKFIIITANHFPTGDAGAVRLNAFANILIELGYFPMVISLGESTGFQEKTISGIRYISLRYPGDSLVSRGKGRLFFNSNLKKVFKQFSPEKIKGILIDSGGTGTFSFVKKYAQTHHIPLYYDSVEWYSPSEFKNGERNISYRLNHALNTEIIDSCYRVISISRYLEDHFMSRGIQTIRIPVMMDVANTNSKKTIRQSEKIKIVYAGSIGGKDHIQELIEAIGMLNQEEAKRISLCIIGITQEQYEKKFGAIKGADMKQTVCFMGRVGREMVLEQLETADFSFLLRPAEERYARAGFPTKVVEGLTTGTPILCNYSSDLEWYLKDGINSVIIEDCSTEACLKALRKTLTYSNDDLMAMRVAARKTAEENFDWRLYVEPMKRFVNFGGDGMFKSR